MALTIGSIVEGNLTKYPDFYDMLSIKKRKTSAFFLWNIGKYFNKQTQKVENLIVGKKYKIDDEGYIFVDRKDG